MLAEPRMRTCHASLALLAIAWACAWADVPAKSPNKTPEAKSSRTLDPAKLPPNAVIIVSDNPRDSLQNVEGVVLSPDEYKKLLEAAEQAKKISPADKPEPPSICRISGRIETRGERDVAVLKIVYEFRTTVPRTMVALGLQKAKPINATTGSGQMPVLMPLKDDDGFAVRLDSAGEHKVIVEVEAPVTARTAKGGDRGIEMGLPGAAITTIEKLELPPGVNRARIAGRNVAARQLISGTDAAPAVLLGPSTKLEAAWDSVPSSPGESQTIVEGRYDVRVEEHSILTRARLNFKPLSGAVARWELAAPPNAVVTAEAAAAIDSTLRIDKPRDKTKPWVIHRESSSDDVTIDVVVRNGISPGKPAPIALIPVTGATQYRGAIFVTAPAQLKLTLKPNRDVSRRESAEDANHESVFDFFQLPESGSPLTIEVQPASGDVETHVEHQLTMAERGWRWQGKFEVTPIRTEATCVDVDVPAEIQSLRVLSAEIVEGISPLRDLADDRKLVRVQLAESRRRPFTFTLEGIYANLGSNSASLRLPRALGTLDRGGSLSAAAPPGIELRGHWREWDGDRSSEWERPLDAAPRGAALSVNLDRAPARIELTWRDPRVDFVVNSIADIQLGERQATVRQQWRMPSIPGGGRQLTLRGPAQLAGRIRALEGATISQSSPGEWLVQLAGLSGRETSFAIAYSFPLPTGPNRPAVAAPLVWLEPAGRCETDVRIWSATTPNGVLAPTLADGPWTEVAPQIVADRPTLPTLALHSSGQQAPLLLQLAEAPAGPGVGLIVERIWVQAMIDEDGQQAYRTRCLIRPQQTHFLDVELPAPPTAIQFAALIDGKRINWTTADGTGGRSARLRLDPTDGPHRTIALDLIYVMAPTRAGSTPWRITLKPPKLRGPVFSGPVRWQIVALSGETLVDLDESTDWEQRWTIRHGLIVPRPRMSISQLNHWFSSDQRYSSNLDSSDEFQAELVGWQASAESIRLLMAPRGFLLICVSLAVLLVGWSVSLLSPRWRRIVVFLLLPVIVWLAWARPQLLTVVLVSAEPGLVVLLVAALARWWLDRRRNRRELFSPGFVRSTPESRLHRNQTKQSSGQPAALSG